MNDTLYNKYRPVTFDDVVGQDVIVTTLKNQIITNKVGHAYLFCGTKGTGKTTVAKIFARAVNCNFRQDANPCNKCESCEASLNRSSINIVEMDAASNKGIDNIRNLKNEIEYAPMNGDKYKIYILDEVHELSNDAFSALLKTLEEPPEYVIFILATTNVEELPDTILSRCQRYNFNRIKLSSIVENLEKIAKLENINIDKEALIYIAEKSDGSMRDSISKLDRCRLIDENETLTREKVASILGLVDDTTFKDLLFSIHNTNIENMVNIIATSLDNGKDILQFTNDLIWHIRNVLLVKDLKEVNSALNISENHFMELKEESEIFTRQKLIFYIRELSKVVNSMRYDENRRVTLESNLIKLSIIDENINNNSYNYQENIPSNKATDINANNNNSNSAINNNNTNNNYHNKTATTSAQNTAAATAKSENVSQNLTEVKNEKKETDNETIEKNFNEVFTELVGFEKTILKKCNILLSNEKDKLNQNKNILGVTFSMNALDYSLLGNKEKIEEISNKIQNIIKTKFNRDSVVQIKKIEIKNDDKTLDEIADEINALIKENNS